MSPQQHSLEEAMYHMDRNPYPLVAVLREEITELEAQVERGREVIDSMHAREDRINAARELAIARDNIGTIPSHITLASLLNALAAEVGP